jgi:hypothetical protein
MRVPKLSKLRLPQLWGPITLCADLWSKWGLKQSCSPCWELSNGMLHAIYTQGNWGNSRLLVVGNQIANLTLNPSFDHNLCFKCPNGSCEPTLDIYVPKYFQWYKDSPIQWVLTLAITLWKFGNPPRLQLPKWELTWECECSFSRTLLHSQPPESMKCDSRVSLLALTLVSPCLGCKPKARVATITIFTTHNIKIP